MVLFIPLGSGSKGNSIYIATQSTRILVDAGFSGKNLIERLALHQISITSIDAIIITHEHIDHIRGLTALMDYQIPIICNSDTAHAISDLLKIQLCFKIFMTGESFTLGDIKVTTFSVSHDAIDPIGLTIHALESNIKIGIATDLGIATSLIQRLLLQMDLLYLEANHQEEYVHASPRHISYKKRVLSKLGHLSNQECGKLIQSLLHSNLQAVYLAHLSSECNNPTKALDVVKSYIPASYSHLPIMIALQDETGPCFTLSKAKDLSEIESELLLAL
jgi:phosphoribosyl 1,2-cyclic phosphodiesterase